MLNDPVAQNPKLLGHRKGMKAVCTSCLSTVVTGVPSRDRPWKPGGSHRLCPHLQQLKAHRFTLPTHHLYGSPEGHHVNPRS